MGTTKADKPAFSRAYLDKLARDLTDKGLFIEAGFTSLRAQAMHPDSPADQVREMRMAFFAGAQHLFGGLMQVLDPDADMERMSRIADELQRFIDDVTKHHLPTQGNA